MTAWLARVWKVVQPPPGSLAARLALACLAVYQTLAYAFYLPLGMGPHVILQPWLINQGWKMYLELPDHHTPLVPYAMAFFQRIVGSELRTGKLVLLALLLVALILVYFLALRFTSERAALLAAAFFVFWSPAFKFGQLRFDLFLTVFYLLAWAVWLPGQQTQMMRRAFLAGVALGLAFLVKQHALLFLSMFMIWQFLAHIRLGRSARGFIHPLLASGAGFCLPVGLFFGGYILSGGAMDRLIFWVFTFNDAGLVALLALAPTAREIQQLIPALLLVPGYIAWMMDQIRQNRHEWISGGVPASMMMAGILLSTPRFGAEHLQPALAGLAILSGIVLDQLLSASFLEEGWRRRALAGGLLGMWLLYPLSGVLSVNPSAPARSIHEYSLLPPLAKQIRGLIGAGECPYLFPEDEANSNLHYFLNCQPPGQLWLFSAYPWFSRFDLPERALVALQSASPRWVVYFPGRWNVEQHNPQVTAFITAGYERKSSLADSEGEVWLLEKR